MNCPNCATAVSPLLFRCPFCGAPLPPPPGAVAAPITPSPLTRARLTAPRDGGRLAAKFGLAAVIGVDVAAAVCALNYLSLLIGWQWPELTGRFVPVQFIMAAIAIVAGLFGAVFFLCWLYRARRTLDGFDDVRPNWGMEWTIGGWFIPVANLVLGGAVVADVGRMSAERLADAERMGRRAWRWWISYLLALTLNPAVIGYLFFQLTEANDWIRDQLSALDSQAIPLIVFLPNAALSIFAATFFTRTVSGINQAQRARMDRLVIAGR